MSDDMNHARRTFMGAAVLAIAAAELAMTGPASAQAGKARPIKPGTHKSFASLKQIDAGVLSVAYAEAGPATGPVVILLHGWPYDIHTYVDVAPLLASAGYRVLVPYLRGYGPTRFLASETFRNGQPSAVAVDIIAFMDALKIEKATLAGCDWGARTANIVAALWPERCKSMVSVSGYLIGSQEAGKMPLAPGSGAPVVVPILFRHGARPHRLRQEPARLCETHLAARLSEVEVRRRHVRSQCRVLRQSGSRRHRDPQLPVAACARRRRIEVRRARQEAGRIPGHRGAHDHARRRRQRCAASRTLLRMRRSFRADTLIASSRAVSDTTCHRKRQRRSPRR